MLFTATITPYEVALLSPGDWTDYLFLTNRFIDAIFIVDMCIQFILVYEKKSGAMMVWVSNPCEIASHYLKGWFTLDFTSVLISGKLPRSRAQLLASNADALLTRVAIGVDLYTASNKASTSNIARLKVLRVSQCED